MSGGDWYAVAAEPLADTLLVLDRLEEVERIDRLVARGERIDLGFLMNAAFAGGEKGGPHPLTEANRRYLADLARPLGDPAAVQDAADATARERAAQADLIRAIAEANARRAAGAPIPEHVS